MKQLLLIAMAAGTFCIAQQAGGRGAGRSGAAPDDGVPREIPSNQVTGIDIDRFIGYPSKAFTKVTNGGLMARSMLRNGDPYNPGPNGAVLEYRDDLSRNARTPLRDVGVPIADDLFLLCAGGRRYHRFWCGNRELQAA